MPWNPWLSIMVSVWFEIRKTKTLCWNSGEIRNVPGYHLQTCSSRCNFSAGMIQIPHIFGHAAILKQQSATLPHTSCRKINLRCTENKFHPRSTWMESIVPSHPTPTMRYSISRVNWTHRPRGLCMVTISSVRTTLVLSWVAFNLTASLFKTVQKFCMTFRGCGEACFCCTKAL